MSNKEIKVPVVIPGVGISLAVCGGGRAGDKPALTLVEPDESAQSCECASWCQAGGKFLASHHRNCRHYDLESDAHKIITDLLRGIEASAQDTDGIHPTLWEAYKRGKASVWEFDWKEEE